MDPRLSANAQVRAKVAMQSKHQRQESMHLGADHGAIAAIAMSTRLALSYSRARRLVPALEETQKEPCP